MCQVSAQQAVQGGSPTSSAPASPPPPPQPATVVTHLAQLTMAYTACLVSQVFSPHLKILDRRLTMVLSARMKRKSVRTLVCKVRGSQGLLSQLLFLPCYSDENKTKQKTLKKLTTF